MAVTTTSFLVRYPEFKCVTGPRIQIALDDAAGFVDVDTWAAADFDKAQMALAAHMLVTEGAFAASGGPSAIRGPIVSERLGDASTTYGRLGSGSTIASASVSQYSTTVYGQTYMRLLNVNFPAVAIV